MPPALRAGGTSANLKGLRGACQRPDSKYLKLNLISCYCCKGLFTYYIIFGHMWNARTKSIAVTKLFKLLFNNFALDKHALYYALYVVFDHPLSRSLLFSLFSFI